MRVDDLALDRGAVGDVAGRRHALGERLGLALRGESGHRDRALRHRIDLSVGAAHRRQQQRAAHQRRRVAHRRHRDVNPCAARGKRRQFGGDHHRRDIARAQIGVAHVHAHAVHHRLQRLAGERRILQSVAGALQSDHEAVADELIVAHALDRSDVLDPHRRAGGNAGQNGDQDESAGAKKIACQPSLDANGTIRLHGSDDHHATVEIARLHDLAHRAVLEGLRLRHDAEAVLLVADRDQGSHGHEARRLHCDRDDRLARQQGAPRDLADQVGAVPDMRHRAAGVIRAHPTASRRRSFRRGRSPATPWGADADRPAPPRRAGAARRRGEARRRAIMTSSCWRWSPPWSWRPRPPWSSSHRRAAPRSCSRFPTPDRHWRLRDSPG